MDMGEGEGDTGPPSRSLDQIAANDCRGLFDAVALVADEGLEHRAQIIGDAVPETRDPRSSRATARGWSRNGERAVPEIPRTS
jgi:hypothetical protein